MGVSCSISVRWVAAVRGCGAAAARRVCMWRGTDASQDPSALISDESRISFFDQFSAVVATQLSEGVLRTLAKYLFAKNIPLLAIRTNGLIATLRVQVPEMRSTAPIDLLLLCRTVLCCCSVSLCSCSSLVNFLVFVAPVTKVPLIEISCGIKARAQPCRSACQ